MIRIACCLGLSIFVMSAQADVITGGVWFVTPTESTNAIPANVPSTPADVLFDVNSPLAFSTGSSPSTTLEAFLASGGAFNLVENTPGALTQDSNDILMEFVGVVSVTNGQTFTVQHDDGLTLIIGGIDLGFNPGPTPPVVSVATYPGPTGTFPFQLVYGECCGGPAILNVDLPFVNAPVPEPSTLALLIGGLLMAGAGRKLRLWG